MMISTETGRRLLLTFLGAGVLGLLTVRSNPQSKRPPTAQVCRAKVVNSGGRLRCAGSEVEGVAGLLLGRKMDINQASEDALCFVPGIGERLAERIVRFRSTHGPFDSMEALQRVSGIGRVMQKRLALYAEVKPSSSRNRERSR